jgi:large repetitive protein
MLICHLSQNNSKKKMKEGKEGKKKMKKKIVAIGICMLMIIIVGLPATGNTNKISPSNDKVMMEFAPGEFIVKIKQDKAFSTPALTVLNEKHQIYAVEMVFPNAEGTILENTYLLYVPIGSDILSIVLEYELCPDVEYAEPNGICYPCSIPNDANFSNQWYLHNTGQVFLNWMGVNYSGTPDADIDAPEAWDIETGSPDVVIGEIDTGIDYMHPDLAANIWNNTDEIPGNDIDDDHNGYIDDIRGWNFYDNDSNVTDGYGHGTLCSGVAVMVTDNGIGGAGVAPNCKLMPVKVYNENATIYWDGAAQGIKYAADNGADVINMEFATNSVPNIIKDAVNYAYGKGVFLCAAAGNANTQQKFYPAAFDNVTAVAATNQDDKRCSPEDWGPGSGSNFGDWVDIAAPGHIIFSTMPTYHVYMNDIGYYQNFDFAVGTSLAAPMVAGVAALLLSIDPSLTPDEVKALLCENVDPYNSTLYIGTGRLNAQKALAALQLSDLGVKIKGGLGVNIVITNNGTMDIANVSWQIHVEGGILGMINKTVNGTVDIQAGKSVSVKTGMLLGFGAISIVARVADEEQTSTGTQIIIFSMVKK